MENSRPLDIAVIGAGNRARKYLSCLPGGVRVRCIAEPDPLRLGWAARRHGVPAADCFDSATAFFASGRKVDAVIIAAPDKLHVPLSLEAVGRGMHVLLEKPVAPSEAEYRLLMDAAARSGAIVTPCLEMRYHPYYRRIRELVASGAVGEPSAVDHTEHIGPDRMAHTFVRGLWSRVEDSCPIFLSKCCHDADFLLWLCGGTVEGVSSTGSIGKFRYREDTPLRCNACAIGDCPYSAVELYLKRREWTDGFDVPEGSSLEDVIREELAGGRYGRCVYHCDNDVFDTQDAEVLLSGGIRLSMHLEGTSMQEGRSTKVIGSSGTLLACDGCITVCDSGGRTVLQEDYSALMGLPLHAGADRALVEDFFGAVASGHKPQVTLESAFEGHRLCYRCA